MSLNDFALNGSMVDGGKTLATGSGTLVNIEQDVQLRFGGSGTLVTIEQDVRAKGSGTLVTIQQVVEAP